MVLKKRMEGGGEGGVELVRAQLNGVTELRFCFFLGEECEGCSCSSLVLLSRLLSTDTLFSTETE